MRSWSLNDVRSEARAFIAPLADVIAGPRWTAFANFEDEVTDPSWTAMTSTCWSTRTRRAGAWSTSASAPSLATAATVVPQGSDVIEGTVRARDGIYLRIMDGGISRLRKLNKDGRVAEIALPFECTIGSLYTTESEDGALMSLSSWFPPTGIFSVDAAGRIADTGITPKPAIDVSAPARLFAAARTAPNSYTLIYRKA
jgi:prolyl oligopeptidase